MSTRLFLGLLIATLIALEAKPSWGQSIRDLELVRHAENSNGFSQTYLARFSDVYPDVAARFRDQINEFKAQKNREIRQALARGDEQQSRAIRTEARQQLFELVSEINRRHPPTSVTIWGKAVKSDIRQALRVLKDRPDLLGQPMHVYLKDGKANISAAAPAAGEFDRRPVAPAITSSSGSLEATEDQLRVIAQGNPVDAIFMGRDQTTGRKRNGGK